MEPTTDMPADRLRLAASHLRARSAAVERSTHVPDPKTAREAFARNRRAIEQLQELGVVHTLMARAIAAQLEGAADELGDWPGEVDTPDVAVADIILAAATQQRLTPRTETHQEGTTDG